MAQINYKNGKNELFEKLNMQISYSIFRNQTM